MGDGAETETRPRRETAPDDAAPGRLLDGDAGAPADEGTASAADDVPPTGDAEEDDEGASLPPWVWLAFAVLAGLTLFLALRLAVVRGALTVSPSGSRPEGTIAVPAPGPTGEARARGPLPPASPQAFAALVEGWRLAWQRKDLERYLGHYASSFGCQGRDLAAWAEHKRKVFAAPEPFQIEIKNLRSSVHESIAIVTFQQIYRSGAYRDRGEKKLYLLPEDGQWRIFNEEWKAIE